MEKIKYGLINDGNLCYKTGDKEGVVFCHRNHTDRCSCSCAAFQVTEDKDGKKVAVLHCFPEPREIDVEFEIAEDPLAIANREEERWHRENLARMMESPSPVQGMMRPGAMTPRDTGLPIPRLDPDVIRDLDGDDNPRNNGGR